MTGGGARSGIVVVIPASLASKRLPRKMLLRETGRPLVVHTCECALGARRVDRVLVATDSAEIRDAVRDAGVEVVDTSSNARTGTDRMAEVARVVDAPFFINLQGDEPQFDPGDLDRVADALREGAGREIVTLSQPLAEERDWRDPNTVKVVTGRDGRALYFSRAPIPFRKQGEGAKGGELGRKHVGVYGFGREMLLEFASLPRTPLEEREGLEQLRALEHGWPIRVLESAGNTMGINSPEDYERFVASWRERTTAETKRKA